MPAGRPRSEAARIAVLRATREVLATAGYDKLTIDAVAAAAGVAKQTIYRWYHSKSSLVADCLLQGYVLTPVVELQRAGTVRDDVQAWMHGFMTTTRDAHALALIRAASAAAAEDPDVARGFQQQVNSHARDEIAARLREGAETGEIRADAAAVAVADILVGSMMYRLLTRREITEDFVDDLTRTVFDGVAVRPRK